MNYFKQSLFKNILMTKIWLSGPPWGPRRARDYNIKHSEYQLDFFNLFP